MQKTKIRVYRTGKVGIAGGNIMDKKVLKKILFVLSILFTILTFVGATYVLFNKGQVSAGYSAVPMLWAVLFTTTYNKIKRDLERGQQFQIL